MNTIGVVLWGLISYVIGSFPVGYMIGKWKGINILEKGSRSMGATNSSRELGIKVGVLVGLLDAAKGAVSVYIAHFFGFEPWQVMVCGALAVLGHCYSVVLFRKEGRWEGGKGVATGLGALLAFGFPLAMLALGIWFIVLLIWRHVSLASMAAVGLLVPISPYFGYEKLVNSLIFVLAALIVSRHWENVERLINGTEKFVRIEHRINRRFAAHWIGAQDAKYHVLFMVHFLGSTADVSWRGAQVRFPWMRLVPKQIVHRTRRLFPYWSRYLRGNSDVVLSDGEKVGIHVISAISGVQELIGKPPKKWALKDLWRTIFYALRLLPKQPEVIALGAATGIAGENGRETALFCRDKLGYKGVVTNGNTYTADALYLTVRKVWQDFYSHRKISVAVVGVGSVGKKLVDLVDGEADFCSELLLVGKNFPDVRLQNMASRMSCTEHVPVGDAFLRADVIIMATSSDEQIVIPEESLINKAQVVIDAGKPANVDRRLAGLAHKLVIAGGLLLLPGGKAGFGNSLGYMGNIIFACGAESVILGYLAAKGELKDLLKEVQPKESKQWEVFVGPPNKKLSRKLREVGEKIGIKPASFHDPHSNQKVTVEEIEQFRRLVE